MRGIDHPIVPIVSRPPEADLADVSHLTSASRPGDGASTGIFAPPPEALLPPGGLLAPAPSPASGRAIAPDRALALDAHRVVRGLRDASSRPDRWAEASFAFETDRIRLHLRPLRSRRMLAASFGREAFHVACPSSDPVSPIRVAYALRWLELGDGAPRGTWPDLLREGQVAL